MRPSTPTAKSNLEGQVYLNFFHHSCPSHRSRIASRSRSCVLILATYLMTLVYAPVDPDRKIELRRRGVAEFLPQLLAVPPIADRLAVLEFHLELDGESK